MTIRYKRVVVDAWCTKPGDPPIADPAESKVCARIILQDEAEIDDAVNRTPYTSKDLGKGDATRFKQCIEKCHGIARIFEV